MQTITYFENADPVAVAKIEAARAKLKPSCTRCGRTLTKREIRGEKASERVCANRSECIVRVITRKPKLNLMYTYPPKTLNRSY